MMFHATRLLVKDFQTSLRFYRDLLSFQGWHNDAMEYAYFEAQQLSLFARAKMPQTIAGMSAEPSSTFVLQFEVEDVDDAYRSLSDKGVKFVTPPTDMHAWGSRIALFHDPDGNLIELYKSIREM